MTFRCPDPRSASKRLHGLTNGLLVRPYAALLRAFTVWKLKRECERTIQSFLAVSEALGISIWSPRQTPEQRARLHRVHEIRNQLLKLKFPHLSQTNPKTL